MVPGQFVHQFPLGREVAVDLTELGAEMGGVIAGDWSRGYPQHSEQTHTHTSEHPTLTISAGGKNDRASKRNYMPVIISEK